MKIKRVIDISRKIETGMAVWPGDSGIKIHLNSSIRRGDPCNVSSIDMGLHTGTHIDAPLHFFDGMEDISKLDLSMFIGYVRVFELNVSECIAEDDIKDLHIEEGDAVFFKTSNSEIPLTEQFKKDYVYIGKSACEFLIGRGVKTVGIDYLSIDGYFTEDYLSHYTLLSNGIGVIEGLYLKGIKPGKYFFSCLPLNIDGADGSPARAVLLEME
ncbi:cyclase family protein [Pseudobacteroides cellulosolvens]|uniref:Kynurenine formamidase n=1 Tax=Pseudobacteroides cellulosolvens ATCC 35603 = DSM 2933 TaxID=398512 RepID=A0A0L6JTZ1_9FIRM|nr:cyclase family protein [Pseudobacteroides cellulosolvens]KNY29273.1 Arylformamidase [Pseudobacteroides cellulosolvens ATCC 35603 = DSM 2933]